MALISPSTPSEDYGELQRLVDDLYRQSASGSVKRVDVIIRAEVNDLPEDLMEVVNLLPSGSYKRARLCDQLNAILTAHGWAFLYGTVEEGPA